MGNQTGDSIDILVVGDVKSKREALAEVLRASFEGNGVRVYEAADGDEVYDGIDRNTVLFLGLNMHGMSGYSVLEHLEKSRIMPRGIAVISMSGNSPGEMDAVRNRARQMYRGEIEFLPKPDAPAEAVRWVGDIINWASNKIYRIQPD